MRQFLTLRYWLTILALAGLVLVLVLSTGGSDGAPSGDGLATTGPLHRVDLVASVDHLVVPTGFALVDGRTNGDIEVVLDATRTMHVKAGTPAVLGCPEIAQPSRCVIGADLLGDAVLWFGLLPGTPGSTVRLPGIVELLDRNEVRLSNGWVLMRSYIVTRVCDKETTSLNNFVSVFGESSTSTFDVERQQVVKVTCTPVTSP